jgi:DNA repair exonuclease SbcCD ATPase subunit
MEPARAGQQEVVDVLTEMQEMDVNRRMSTLLPQTQQEVNASQVPIQELDTLGQQLNASRTRELELATSRAGLADALQTAQSALHASQAQLQRVHDDMEAMRHATNGTIMRGQQELDASRVQLHNAAQASQARERELDELRSQRADAERALEFSQARMQELRQELDISQVRQDVLLQRVSAAESEIKSQEESLNASVKVGYISRACQEFIAECPTWTQSTGVALLSLSREDALDMVNILEEFDAVCSEPRRAPLYLDSSSTAIKFKKAWMAFSLLLHPDKIAAKAVPHRRQCLSPHMHFCIPHAD